MMDSILTPKRWLQQPAEYFNYLYGTSWWVNLSANISKSANCCLLDRAFVCRSFAQFPWTTPWYLSKSAKHQDLTNVQMSRIGSCDQRRNSDIWFWHIEVCLGLVGVHINMTRKCHTNLFEVLYKCVTDPHHLQILQIKSPTCHKCVMSYVIFRKHPENPCPHVPWSARPPLPNSLAHTGEPNTLRPTSDHRSQAPATFHNEMEGWNPSVA